MWAATAEMIRVLKPTGNIWINLGDKYAGSGGHNNAGISSKSTLQGNGHVGGGPKIKATLRSAPDRYNQSAEFAVGRRIDKGEQRYVKGDVPKKSLMGLPWRYALGCIDHLGLILRAEVVWSKPNGLPESVTDRVRRSHEQWFHFTKQGRYFAAVDEVRAPYEGDRALSRRIKHPGQGKRDQRAAWNAEHPLGPLPGSVWTIATEPLTVPANLGIDHFAAFPSVWPARIIAGWSPGGICMQCGEGRRPITTRKPMVVLPSSRRLAAQASGNARRTSTSGTMVSAPETAITGYACVCPEPTADTRPAVILDPFGGTGTVAMVARAMGRYGISVDMSSDYCRLAQWRIFESGGGEKAVQKAVAKGLIAPHHAPLVQPKRQRKTAEIKEFPTLALFDEDVA